MMAHNWIFNWNLEEEETSLDEWFTSLIHRYNMLETTFQDVRLAEELAMTPIPPRDEDGHQYPSSRELMELREMALTTEDENEAFWELVTHIREGLRQRLEYENYLTQLENNDPQRGLPQPPPGFIWINYPHNLPMARPLNFNGNWYYLYDLFYNEPYGPNCAPAA